MENEHRIARLRSQLICRSRMLADEHGDKHIQRLIRAGHIVRVVRGCYLDSETWRRLWPDEKLLARTIAVAMQSRNGAPLFSHYSAAAIWGLPLFGLPSVDERRAHVLTKPTMPGRSSGTRRCHVAEWRDSEEATVAGLRVTTLERTILDLARAGPAELAIGCADAGVRRALGGRRDARPIGLEDWREVQLQRLGEKRGARGSRGASAVIRLADPRADSVAESVSRLQLARLGVEHEIQVQVPGVDGAVYWMDFEFTGQRTFGEVDGRVKYVDAQVNGGVTAEQVVLEEKAREDEVRGSTGKRVVRWEFRHITPVRTFGSRLQQFGIRVPRLE